MHSQSRCFGLAAEPAVVLKSLHCGSGTNNHKRIAMTVHIQSSFKIKSRVSVPIENGSTFRRDFRETRKLETPHVLYLNFEKEH